ncbi:MAG: hypothetical protein H6907_09695 [Hyphomicrobiales bacterium]|nr:hypothetical protein [Hyphomicrobiales bacterium]MCP5371992.1 hypothetical protein [Hyphomicrobiales bacterium]
MVYGSGRKRRGARRARRAAAASAAIGGAVWFLLGYTAFEQIKPLAKLPLMAQIGAFAGIGLGVVVGLWIVVRAVAPVFYRRRSTPLDVDKTVGRAQARAAGKDPAPDPDPGAGAKPGGPAAA